MNRMRNIEWFRALACLNVVLLHLNSWSFDRAKLMRGVYNILNDRYSYPLCRPWVYANYGFIYISKSRKYAKEGVLFICFEEGYSSNPVI